MLRLRNTLRGLVQMNPIANALRDQPASSPAPQPAAQSGGPGDATAIAAIARSRLLPTMIEAGDLTAGVFNASQWSVLGYYEVPQGVVLRLPRGRSFRFYIKAKASQAGQNSGAPANPTTITCPGLVESQQASPALPTDQNPNAIVWCEVGGVWSQVAVSSINYTTGAVQFTEPANCTNVEAYYLHNRGLWRLRVQRQLGNSDTSAIMVANGSFGGAHTVDQNNVETSLKWPRNVALIPGQRLNLEVDSSLTHSLDARAEQTLILNAFAQMVDVTDPALLRRIAEIDLREGL